LGISKLTHQIINKKLVKQYLTTPLVDWPMAIFSANQLFAKKSGRRVMVIAESFSMGKDNIDGV
jgi:hypothetical protein